MAETWYATTYRKLFFDFHSPGTAVGLASAFDAERWAERLVAAHAQAVSVFTKCGYGYSFYQKGHIRYLHPHLPAGLDMLEAQIAALHRRGLRAIGYYHTFNSEPIARDHPEWIERDASGTPRGIQICLLSPLTEEWMLPHIAEIVSLYEVDAMFFDGTYAHSVCTCAACQRRFAADSGGLAIPRDPSDPAWPRYVAWKLAALREVRQAICDTIHAIRPEVIVSINWAYTPRMPELVPDGVGALVADIVPDDQVSNGSYLSSYWATLQRPFDVMNTAFLQWWGDWGCKPAIAMQQEVATTLAHGGLTWVGYQMTHTFDVAPAVMQELGRTLEFVRQREPLLLGVQPVPYVGVLHSTNAHLTATPARFWVDETSARGAHRLLTESMIPFHFLHEEALAEWLPQLKAVILPDQRYLSPGLVKAIARWVREGGVLIATACTGTLNDAYAESGRFALEDVLGVRYEGVFDQPHAYIEVQDPRLKGGTLDMPHLAEAVFALARPIADDVEVLATLRRPYLRSDGQFLLRWSPPGEESGYPAITLRRLGQGWAAYIAGEIFHAFHVKNQWNFKAIVANLLRLTVAEPPVEVMAPTWLEVTLMHQPAAHAPNGRGRLLVHLVNQHGDRPASGDRIGEAGNRCVEQILPVRDVTVRLHYPQRPARVTLEPAGATPAWSYDAGVVTVMVPEVVIHCAIAVEGQA